MATAPLTALSHHVSPSSLLGCAFFLFAFVCNAGHVPAQSVAPVRLPPLDDASNVASDAPRIHLIGAEQPAYVQETVPNQVAADANAPPLATPVNPDPEIQAILDRLNALEQNARTAEPTSSSPNSASKAPADASKGDAAYKEDTKKDDGKAGSAKSDDIPLDKWNVKLGGHVQMDWIHWADASPQIPEFDYFEFRRLRLLADGAGYGVYDFRLQVDFEPEGGDNVSTPVVDVKDAYFTANHVPVIDRWRIGNFFVPFSLEQVTNDTNNIFLERSIPTQGIFAADREVGVAFYAVNDDKDFTFTSGVFFDSISESTKERIDDNQGTRISGRMTWLPYYDEPSNGRYLVHLGTGVLYTDDHDKLVRFRARPQIHEGPFLIDTGNIPASDYISANLEFATVWGPFSVQSEAFFTGVNTAVGDPAHVYGAYIYGSYFLTGENRIYERYGQHGAQFGRNKPFSNFFLLPNGCGWGAWEAKCRYSNLTLAQLDAGQYNDITVGFNHYWSDRIRVMFDWIHPLTTKDSRPYGSTRSDVVGLRFDFNW